MPTTDARLLAILTTALSGRALSESIPSGASADVFDFYLQLAKDMLTAVQASIGPSTGIDHGTLVGLADDDHVGYARLTGRSGGQTLQGGTASGNGLTLNSTAHATKGTIFLGASSAYDEVNGRLGIGTTTPGAQVHIYDGSGNAFAAQFFEAEVSGGYAGCEVHYTARNNSAATPTFKIAVVGADADYYNDGTSDYAGWWVYNSRTTKTPLYVDLLADDVHMTSGGRVKAFSLITNNKGVSGSNTGQAFSATIQPPGVGTDYFQGFSTAVYIGTLAGNITGEVEGLDVYMESAKGQGASYEVATMYGTKSSAALGSYGSGTNDKITNYLYGTLCNAHVNSTNTGTVVGTAAYGLSSIVTQANKGTVVEAAALYGRATCSGTGTITTAYAVRAVLTKTAGTITTGVGLRVDDVTGQASTAWAAQFAGGNSYHVGAMTLGAAAAPTASTLLDLSSTTGALLVPRMTTTQRNALTATKGMIVYDSTLNSFMGYQGAGAWAAM